MCPIVKGMWMKELIVAGVQVAGALGAVSANVERMRLWVDRAASSGAQVVFFPECSMTGFEAKRASCLAIDPDDEVLSAFEGYAARRRIAVGYGFIERRDETHAPFNAYVVSDGENRLIYRKTHLGESERAFFSQGESLPVERIAGVCVGLQLCWEGHVPDIATALRAKGAELLLAPHACGLGGQRRIEAWCRYLPARALDNGLFVLACNALKPDGRGGGLAAFGPDGMLIDSYGGGDEHMLVVPVGGVLPREEPSDGMKHISYFDRRRPELY